MEFVRIKNYIVNLEATTYIRVGEDYIDFGFAFPTEKLGGQNYVRLVKGVDVQEGDFSELREFVFGLPDPDRVIVV